MSFGNLMSIRTIVREGLPKCLCSVVQDEYTGTIHDPEKMGEAIIRHAENMHEQNERLYRDAARVVLGDIKEQARLMEIANGYDGPVLQHSRSDATYDSVTAWVESLEYRLIGETVDTETTDYEVHWDSPRLTRPTRGDEE